MLQLLRQILLSSVILCFGAGFVGANHARAKGNKRPRKPLTIKVVPVGNTQEAIDAQRILVARSAALRKLLEGTQNRLLEFEPVLQDDTKNAIAKTYRAYFYDYTNSRTILAEGNFGFAEPTAVRETDFQPIPSEEEFEAATKIIESDKNFGALVQSGSVKTYRAMPPVNLIAGSNERIINVGLDSSNPNWQHQIVGVNLKRGELIKYAGGAPPTSKAEQDACGVMPANQTTTPRGTAGQFNLTISTGQTLLWEMTVIRPSVSSGTRGSGIEIQNVKYKGKSVLKRGHSPILNVKYDQDICGPFRDWQWQEDFFQTPETGNTDPGPGFRIVAPGQVATTVLESGNDTGNFRGVAIYTQDNDAVLVSEMQAGWYRYITEWRFAIDGTIRPRFGFGAVDDSCVCFAHDHNVYWRFDFDIVNPTNKVFQIRRGRKFQVPIPTETIMDKSNQLNRGILIQNSSGDEAYSLFPNISDGIVDDFGRNDLWILRYKSVPGGTNLQNEIDDGFNSVGGECTPTTGTCINIAQFADGESVLSEDVVVWYGGHFAHTDSGNAINANRSGFVISGEHVVGPDIRPVRW